MMVSFRSVDQRLIEASLSKIFGRPITMSRYLQFVMERKFSGFYLCPNRFWDSEGGSFNMMALDVYKQIIGQWAWVR